MLLIFFVLSFLITGCLTHKERKLVDNGKMMKIMDNDEVTKIAEDKKEGMYEGLEFRTFIYDPTNGTTSPDVILYKYTVPTMVPYRHAVRDVLFEGLIAPVGYGAYGYIIFTHEPIDNEIIRYKSVFVTFVSYFRPVKVKSPNLSYMPTYWLAKTRIPDKFCKDNAEKWVENYDYDYASDIAATAGIIGGKGPILVAWKEPYNKDHRPISKALILDLSRISDNNIGSGYDIWKKQINPDIWARGLTLAQIRLEIKNFIETKGDDMMKIIKNDILNGLIGQETK